MQEVPSSVYQRFSFPFALSPDIIRSHEKDGFMIGRLVGQAQSIVRALRGARFAHTHAEAIKHLTEILYFALTTLLGNRTLGEEYCDIVQLEDDTLQLPSLTRRAGYILSSILVPWTLHRILPTLRQRVRAKLERSIARQQAAVAAGTAASSSLSKHSKRLQSARGTSRSSVTKLKLQKYILDHLDSITSLSPIYAVSIATFYFTGSYYHISKRFWGLRYVFSKQIKENEQRVGYEVLGVLLVLQIVVQGMLHVRQVSASLQEQQADNDEAAGLGQPGSKAAGHAQGGRRADATLASVQNPVSLPLLPASAPRYDLSRDPGALPWIPAGQHRKCTLCLDPFKDPSVTSCGHVFCWTCARDWIREKPECPLCRQEVLLSKVLPLKG